MLMSQHKYGRGATLWFYIWFTFNRAVATRLREWRQRGSRVRSGVCELGRERRNAERRHSAGPDRRLQARRPSGAPTGSAQRRQVLCAAWKNNEWLVLKLHEGEHQICLLQQSHLMSLRVTGERGALAEWRLAGETVKNSTRVTITFMLPCIVINFLLITKQTQ